MSRLHAAVASIEQTVGLALSEFAPSRVSVVGIDDDERTATLRIVFNEVTWENHQAALDAFADAVRLHVDQVSLDIEIMDAESVDSFERSHEAMFA